MAYFEKTQISAADSPSTDAFGRWRVSEAFTLFDSKLIYDSGSFLWATKTTGNSTASHQTNQSSVLMQVSSTSGSRVVRQTKRYMPYQPGKSQLIILTGNFRNNTDGVVKRLGYFDDSDGLFFEMSGSSMGVVRRSNTTGTPVDTFVSQSDWNVDKMDGTGISGHRINFSKAQIYFMDFEWLGVGRIRFGMYYGGDAHYVHSFKHEDELDNVYMSTPNLPVRYEITNQLGSATTSSMSQICSTVISEAGYNAVHGIERSVSSGATTIRIDTSAYGMLIAIRQKTNRKAMTVIPTYLSIVTPSGPDKQWSLLVNPTLTTSITGSTNWQSSTDSDVEYITGSAANGSMNTITNEGTKLASGWFSTTNDQISVDLERFISLGIDLDNNRDILVLACRTSGLASDGFASLSFKEIQ